MSTSISKAYQECPVCFGKGYTIKSEIQQDTSGGMLLGAAMGIGYFPLLKLVTKPTLCTRCKGKRVIERES